MMNKYHNILFRCLSTQPYPVVNPSSKFWIFIDKLTNDGSKILLSVQAAITLGYNFPRSHEI